MEGIAALHRQVFWPDWNMGKRSLRSVPAAQGRACSSSRHADWSSARFPPNTAHAKGRVAAIGLKEGDALLCVLPFNAEENLMLLTEARHGDPYRRTEIPVNGRAAAGVRGMALEPGTRSVLRICARCRRTGDDE